MEKIVTMFGALEALRTAMPASVITDIELSFDDVTQIRKAVESGDLARFKEIRNIGNKRAQLIVDILKGRIPAPMSCPCPDIRKPDEEMHSVPNMNLVCWDGVSKMTALKVDKKGNLKKNPKTSEPERDVASKRYGPSLQYLQKVSGEKENIVFTTVSQIPEDKKDPSKTYNMEFYWDKIVHNGIKLPKGKAVPFLMGTNALMKGQIHWTYEEYVSRVRHWMLCGANTNTAVKIAKFEAYMGLLLPYTKKLLDNRLTPDMEVITPEWENAHIGKNVMIDPDGSMKELEEFIVNEFDGMCFIELTPELIEKMHLTRSERRRLERAIAKFNGGTLRAPWHKGVIVSGYHIHDKLKSLGVTHINGKPIDDIAIFGDSSVFKAAIGENGLYEKFEDFSDSFKALGHRYGVLLENHGLKKTFLPSQQLQAAHGADKKHILKGAEAEVAYLKEAQNNPAVAAQRYLPRVIAAMAQENPSIMGMWFASALANNGYEQERTSALSGRTHGDNISGFCIKDPGAYCEWIAYCEGKRTELPTGYVGKYQVFVQERENVGYAVASRNPVIANYGLKKVEVINSLGDEDQFYDEGFEYIVVGIHDDLCKLLRMDHDGDKIRLTFDEWFVDAVESIETDGVFAEWTGFGEVWKDIPTRENQLKFFASATTSPTLGLNVDTFGKFITNRIANTREREMVMDYMMNKGTDVKQGANGSTASGKVGEILNAMKEECKDGKYSIAQSYGKGMKGREVDKEKIANEYGQSNLDIISKAVRDKTQPNLVFNMQFPWQELLISKKMRVITGLAANGHKNKNYEDAGVFNKLVERSAAEWGALDEDERAKDWSEFQAFKRDQAIKEMVAYAKTIDENLDEEDVYDALVTYICGTLQKIYYGENATDNLRKWLIVLARTFIEWFKDRLEKTFCEKMKIDTLKAVAEGVELDEEIF